LSTRWYSVVEPSLEKYFGQVAALDKRSENEFVVKATGSTLCLGLKASLKLVARHDLFTAAKGMMSNEKDKVVFEVAMDELEPVFLAVVPLASEKTFRTEFTDSEVAKSRIIGSSKGVVEENFVVLSDVPSLEKAFLTSQLQKLVQKHSTSINLLYCSDLYPIENKGGHEKVLRFEFTLEEQFVEQMEDMVDLIGSFIETAAKLTLSQTSREANVKARKKLNSAKIKAKREEAQQVSNTFPFFSLIPKKLTRRSFFETGGRKA